MSIDPGAELRRCAFFSQLDDAGFQVLEAMAAGRTFRKGTVIARPEQDAPGMYLVVKGLVRVYKLGANGKEHVLHLADPGKTFLEVAAIAGFPSPAFVEAVEPTVCVMLPAGALRRALQADHRLCLQLLSGMAFWVKHLVGLLEDIVLRDAAGRVARYLLDVPRDEQGHVQLPSRKRDLASHLNLTSETLSRTLRRLDEAELIESGASGSIRILDATGLQRATRGAFPLM